MFANIKTRLLNFLRRKNRERRTASRLNRLKPYDAATKNSRAIPQTIRRVLLISTSEGWGDSLYVAGLARRLKLNGVLDVAVMAPESLLGHFGNPVFTGVWALEREIGSGLAFGPDVVLDLTYIGISNGKERLQLITRLACPAVTVSDLCHHLNAYSTFVAYREKAHISERMALVLGVLTHHEESPIMPEGFASDNDKTHARQTIEELCLTRRPARLAYLNTLARDADRCFSPVQADMMVQTLLKNGFDGIIVNSKVPCLTCNKKIRYLPKMTFYEFTALIEHMDLVVTPDTSVTHLAAYYNIPTFVVFPPNDRDYWSEYGAKDVWGALSNHSVTYALDDANLKIDPFGYASVRPRPCSWYRPTELANALDKFIENEK